jgi:hypothetical protein
MKVAIPILLFVLSGAPLTAAMVTMSPIAPTGDIEVSQLNREFSEDIRWNGPATGITFKRDLVQTFTPTSTFMLDRISVRVLQDTEATIPDLWTGGLTLLVDVFSTANIDTPSGSSLLGGGETAITPMFNKGELVWLTFDLNAPIQLTANQAYGLKFGFAFESAMNPRNRLGGGTVDGGLSYHTGSEGAADQYAGGRMFRYRGGVLDTGWPNASDLTFVLQSGTAPPLHPGDFNGDGNVDALDFVAWQTNFPKSSGAVLALGDADGDGDVDGADFVVWQTNFPYSPSESVGSVPEPTGLALASIALLALGFARLRR